MTTQTTLEPGTRVRFTKGPLGLVDPAQPNRFVERTVDRGDTGTVAEQPVGVHDWIYVDVGDGLCAPVHPLMVEPVGAETCRGCGSEFAADYDGDFCPACAAENAGRRIKTRHAEGGTT